MTFLKVYFWDTAFGVMLLYFMTCSYYGFKFCSTLLYWYEFCSAFIFHVVVILNEYSLMTGFRMDVLIVGIRI